jgi:heme-degrading monooxygenase HmoA
MAVLVTITNYNASIEMYERIATRMIPELKRQAGFHSHFAYAIEDGFVVSEIWDSAEQHTVWFETTVRPNMPAEADPEIAFVKLVQLAEK